MALAASVLLLTFASIFKNTYVFPICVSNSNSTIYKEKTKNKNLKRFIHPALKSNLASELQN